jgi:hypothetical protein
MLNPTKLVGNNRMLNPTKLVGNNRMLNPTKLVGNNRMLNPTKLVGNWGAPKFVDPATLCYPATRSPQIVFPVYLT